MTITEIIRMIKEIGLAAAAMGLCIWIVVYIVKRLGNSVDKLVTRIEIFTNRVRDEHDRHEECLKDLREDHKEFAAQNREITATLGRINGFKD